MEVCRIRIGIQLVVLVLVALVTRLGIAAHQQSTSPPVLGSWRWTGTAPAGFVGQGTQEAQVTLTSRQGHVRGLVSTERHRYATNARYTATQRQLQLTIRTARGSVRVEAAMLKGNQRMVGTWYDARRRRRVRAGTH